LKPSKRQTCLKRQDAFLIAFAKHGSIMAAARAVKINRETVRQWRRDDPVFYERFKDTKLELIELLEDGAVDDAMGEWSPKLRRYIGGNPILKMFLLKKLDPSYRDSSKFEGELSKDGKIASFTLQLGDGARA
jgi:hypothetical protein